MLREFLLICSLFVTIQTYKIAIFAPDFSNSQIMFNQRVAETLANANHSVVFILMKSMEGRDSSDIKIASNVIVKELNISSGAHKDELEKRQSQHIFEDLTMFDPRSREMFAKMSELLTISCQKLAADSEFLSWMKAEKFDVVFSHMYNTCPLGVIHAANVPWIWLNSGALMDYVASNVGVPTIPSYVPPMLMASTDTMTFYERIKSFVGHILMAVMWPRMIPNPETEVFRKQYGNDFPHLLDIAKQCPLVMVNSNELYEFPRPTLSKVINIGGIGLNMKSPKPLSKEFEEIANKGKGIIIFTFGSVAPPDKMPDSWKNALMEAFSRFPEYQFICRYPANDLDDRKSSNVYLGKWIPQPDLLQHPKAKGLITHGGYNSLQESIAAGIPLIAIPLFGDQPKNAKLAEAHGFGISIMKSNLNADTISDAIRKIITDSSYSSKAARLSSMVRSRPISAEQLLIRWTEFVAQFKTLDNMAPAGQKLNFFQYFSLDVISFLLFVILSILFIIYKLIVFIVRKLCCRSSKKQKTA